MNSIDIAKIAGVSRSTVSRVINNYPNVPKETREKIEKIIFFPLRVLLHILRRDGFSIGTSEESAARAARAVKPVSDSESEKTKNGK